MFKFFQDRGSTDKKQSKTGWNTGKLTITNRYDAMVGWWLCWHVTENETLLHHRHYLVPIQFHMAK